MPDLRNRTILLTLAGSHAHGTSRPESDIDISGVAVPSRAQAYGLFQPFEQENDPERLSPFFQDLPASEHGVATRSKLEGTVFGLSKFLLLAAEANPNILEVLFSRDKGSASEKETIPPELDRLAQGDWKRLQDELDLAHAHAHSSLPADGPNHKAVEDWLLRLRRDRM